MLSLKFRILLLAAFCLLLVWLVLQIKKRRLDLRYTLSWLLLDVSLIILTVFPSLLSKISRGLGIYSPVNMIFFCGFGFSLIIIYTLTAAVSKMNEEIKRLSQKISLLEHSPENDREEE